MPGAKVNAGAMRHRLVLERPVLGERDRYGAPARTWVYAGTCYAKLVGVGAREQEIARTYAATVTTRAEIRWRADIQATWRLRGRDRVLGIDGVLDPDGRRRQLVCYCTEVRP